MVPADADAQAQPPTAQDVDFRRLLGDQAGLALRQDQHAAAQLDGPGDGGDEGHRREGLVEGVLLAVDRLPVAARGGAEDMVGDFDAVIAEVFRRLCPVTDPGRIGADVAGREEGGEQHGDAPWARRESLPQPCNIAAVFAIRETHCRTVDKAMTSAARYPVVVIGAGTGGVGPLRIVVEALPRNCRAAIAAAVHIGSRPSSLPDILSWHSKLVVGFASDGEAFRSGRLYIAPPDHHLRLASSGSLRLDRGPLVHNTRPAIDPLFASAAMLYGQRVVAVLLSGAGRDGAEGLRRVVAHGGAAIVQDPQEAPEPSMPQSALALDHIRVMRAAEIARRIVEACAGGFPA